MPWMVMPTIGERLMLLSITTYKHWSKLVILLSLKVLFFELKALMGSPCPTPLIVISETLFIWRESKSEILKRIGWLTPESNKKLSFDPLTSIGNTIRLFTSSNLSFSESLLFGKSNCCASAKKGSRAIKMIICRRKRFNFLQIKPSILINLQIFTTPHLNFNNLDNNQIPAAILVLSNWI